MGIKLVCFDIDGTLTDGRMTYDATGQVSKSYHTYDISALFDLRFVQKLDVLVITGSSHTCDLYRFAFLEAASVDVMAATSVGAAQKIRAGAWRPTWLWQGVQDKWPRLKGHLAATGIDASEVAYFGDHDNDAECLKHVGFSGCPASAPDRIKEVCDFVSRRPGGSGAAADFAEAILRINSVPVK